MTRADLTHLYFLLDRSGSMQSIKSDTEGGFAAFVEEQRQAAGECRVTLARFDDHYEVVYSGLALADVPPLELQPRGSTALLDSMGRLITQAGEELAALPEDQRPGTVVVAIMTDGHENSSKEWDRPAIRSLVEQQSEAYRWQFLYLGADQDAIEVGTSLGVPREQSLTYGRAQTRGAMETMSGHIADLRRERLTDPAAVPAGFTDEERRRLV